MLSITEEASVLIRELQNKTDSDDLKLTLLSAGAGCGAPAIKLEMRQPLEDDKIIEKNGFDLHIRQAIIKFTEGAEITVEESFWGTRLKVKTKFGCR